MHGPSEGPQCAVMPHILLPRWWQVAPMTSSAHIASVLYRTALALLLLVQATHVSATALRMELTRPAGSGFVVICTPSGPKAIALSDLSSNAQQSSHECECPGATLCGANVIAPPATADALRGLVRWPTKTVGSYATSTSLSAFQPTHSGRPRAPPHNFL